jgi:hypothetical protein
MEIHLLLGGIIEWGINFMKINLEAKPRFGWSNKFKHRFNSEELGEVLRAVGMLSQTPDPTRLFLTCSPRSVRGVSHPVLTEYRWDALTREREKGVRNTALISSYRNDKAHTMYSMSVEGFQ